jgi:lipopolysaccharide/colanic/teichoic acid biosynthesis glycosyltransferase
MNLSSLHSEELELLKQQNVEQLHKKALECFDEASVAEFKGDTSEAQLKYQKALRFEKHAALLAQKKKVGQPTVSILFRSAASIAFRANMMSEAFELATLGMESSPPNEIAIELKDILDNIDPSTIARKHTQNSQQFFYIGNKTATNIGSLVDAFEEGHGAETLAIAETMLQSMVDRKTNVLPVLIICESYFDGKEITAFAQFLNKHRFLSDIPFVLEGTALSKKDLEYFRKMPLVDEIIFLNSHNRKSILAKVEFLKKIKRNLRSVDGETPSRNKLFNTKKMGVPHFPVILRRGFDIFISLLLLGILSPLFCLIALAIRIESKGPVFYIAKRAGKGYRIFDFFKFRTMFLRADTKVRELAHLNQYNDGEKGAVFFKINNDPRVTKVGTFLRNTSLDELPQLINVLKGDMSLVGNRPLPLYEAATLTTDDWAKRFLAPAGMTGLWQIKKRGREEMSVEERINLDVNYAAQNNFILDLWIMAKTPSAIVNELKKSSTA